MFPNGQSFVFLFTGSPAAIQTTKIANFLQLSAGRKPESILITEAKVYLGVPPRDTSIYTNI